jgi:hypothetical protein
VNVDTCLWCDEPLVGHTTPVSTMDGPRHQHWECSLRVVTGGIGHLIAHHYWCTQQGDPDAGLTKRQSAVLSAAWVKVVGVEHLPFEDASRPGDDLDPPEWVSASAEDVAWQVEDPRWRTDPEPDSA